MQRSTLDYRRESRIKHPPYGLYLDTQYSEVNWIVVSTRVLMLLTLAMVVVLVVVAFGPLLTIA
jgi:hypothetical protein